MAQIDCIGIEFVGALKHLEVADHVSNHEADTDDSGDGHDCFFSDRRLINCDCAIHLTFPKARKCITKCARSKYTNCDRYSPQRTQRTLRKKLGVNLRVLCDLCGEYYSSLMRTSSGTGKDFSCM